VANKSGVSLSDWRIKIPRAVSSARPNYADALVFSKNQETIQVSAPALFLGFFKKPRPAPRRLDLLNSLELFIFWF